MSIFRRIRKDDTLGEEIVDGRATRFTRHGNHYPRVR